PRLVPDCSRLVIQGETLSGHSVELSIVLKQHTTIEQVRNNNVRDRWSVLGFEIEHVPIASPKIELTKFRRRAHRGFTGFFSRVVDGRSTRVGYCYWNHSRNCGDNTQLQPFAVCLLHSHRTSRKNSEERGRDLDSRPRLRVQRLSFEVYSIRRIST